MTRPAFSAATETPTFSSGYEPLGIFVAKTSSTSGQDGSSPTDDCHHEHSPAQGSKTGVGWIGAVLTLTALSGTRPNHSVQLVHALRPSPVVSGLGAVRYDVSSIHRLFEPDSAGRLLNQAWRSPRGLISGRSVTRVSGDRE
jgi:hypothetical protein